MEPIIIKGKIEFCDDSYKRYDREFTAILRDSPAFSYGNHTAVDIFWGISANGKKCLPTYLDTRYDCTIKCNETDFKKWLQKYFRETYCEHVLTLY